MFDPGGLKRGLKTNRQMRERSLSDWKGTLVSMIAEKYAILYVTSATVCECVTKGGAARQNHVL